MLIGSNTLELNQATVEKAIEDYLNAGLIRKVKVTGLTTIDLGGYGSTYKVTVEPFVPDDPKPEN